MINRHRIRLRIVVPVVILIQLIWIMTGCLYVPFFEHRLESGPNVRALVGDEKSGRPIRPMAVTRKEVIAMMGPPQWSSTDGLAIAYSATTGISSWVYPLCAFVAEPADQKVYAVRLIFNKSGQLIQYDWADESEGVHPMLLFRYNSSLPLEERVIQKLNLTEPRLYRRITPPAFPDTTQP